jgi:hypothetical protein
VVPLVGHERIAARRGDRRDDVLDAGGDVDELEVARGVDAELERPVGGAPWRLHADDLLIASEDGRGTHDGFQGERAAGAGHAADGDVVAL